MIRRRFVLFQQIRIIYQVDWTKRKFDGLPLPIQFNGVQCSDFLVQLKFLGVILFQLVASPLSSHTHTRSHAFTILINIYPTKSFKMTK